MEVSIECVCVWRGGGGGAFDAFGSMCVFTYILVCKTCGVPVL